LLQTCTDLSFSVTVKVTVVLFSTLFALCDSGDNHILKFEMYENIVALCY